MSSLPTPPSIGRLARFRIRHVVFVLMIHDPLAITAAFLKAHVFVDPSGTRHIDRGAVSEKSPEPVPTEDYFPIEFPHSNRTCANVFGDIHGKVARTAKRSFRDPGTVVIHFNSSGGNDDSLAFGCVSETLHP